MTEKLSTTSMCIKQQTESRMGKPELRLWERTNGKYERNKYFLIVSSKGKEVAELE
jgi:hypothetical protein